MRFTTATPTPMQEMLYALLGIFMFLVVVLIGVLMYQFFNGMNQGTDISNGLEKDDDEFLNSNHFKNKKPNHDQ